MKKKEGYKLDLFIPNWPDPASPYAIYMSSIPATLCRLTEIVKKKKSGGNLKL
jgi:hypothetical protein